MNKKVADKNARGMNVFMRYSVLIRYEQTAHDLHVLLESKEI